MLKRFLVPIGLSLLVAAAAVSTQRDFSSVVVKTELVAGNVHVLYGAGGNIGVAVSPEGLLVIDSQFAGLAPKIRAELEKLSEGPVRYLVNTHWHGDHTGGNVELAGDRVVLAHNNVRRRLAGDESIAGRKNEDGDARGFPGVTFEDAVSVHFGGDEIVVSHHPACHTDGDSVIFFKHAKVAHLGDLYFQAGFPFIDLDSGGSAKGLIHAIESIAAVLPRDCRVIPGHGKVTGIEGLEEYLAMLHGCRDLVLEALRSGSSAQEMKDNRLLAAFEERWGGGFIDSGRFLELLAAEFSKK